MGSNAIAQSVGVKRAVFRLPAVHHAFRADDESAQGGAAGGAGGITRGVILAHLAARFAEPCRRDEWPAKTVQALA